MRKKAVKQGRCLWLCVLAMLVTRQGYAQTRWPSRIGGFALGAASGFVAHEYGHLLANVALHNRPELIAVRGLFNVPFVAISPGIACGQSSCVDLQHRPFRAGHRGLSLISSAGFLAQHLTSEVLFASFPGPLWQAPAVWQGMLGFNVAVSLAYATTCLFGRENAYGDASGLAASAGLPRAVVAGAIAVPALFDLGRSLWPRRRWLAYASWASKAAFVSLILVRT